MSSGSGFIKLIAAFEECKIRFAVCGSVASSLHGVARPTQDVDIVAAISLKDAEPLAAFLQGEFYADSETMREAIRRGRSFNVIHNASGLKYDIFPAGSNPLGPAEIQRATTVKTSFVDQEPAVFPLISPEDTILSKLRWYKDGGESSERQWNDLRNVVKVKGDTLDTAYLAEWAPILNVKKLLEELLAGK